MNMGQNAHVELGYEYGSLKLQSLTYIITWNKSTSLIMGGYVAKMEESRCAFNI